MGRSELTLGFKVEMSVTHSNGASSRAVGYMSSNIKEEIWTEDKILESLAYWSGLMSGQRNHSKYLRQKLTYNFVGRAENKIQRPLMVIVAIIQKSRKCHHYYHYMPHTHETRKEK